MSEQSSSERRRFPERKKRSDGRPSDYDERAKQLRAELPLMTRLFNRRAVRSINPDSLRRLDIEEQNATAELIERRLAGAMADPDPQSIGSFMSSLVSRGTLPAAIVSEDASGRFVASAFKFCINELNRRLGLQLKNIPVIPFVSGQTVKDFQARREHAEQVVATLEEKYDTSRPVLFVTDKVASGGSLFPFIDAFFHGQEFQNGPNVNWREEPTRLAVVSQEKMLVLNQALRRGLGDESYGPTDEVPEGIRKSSCHMPGLRTFSNGLHSGTTRDTFRAIERDLSRDSTLIPVETIEERALRIAHEQRMGIHMADALMNREELRNIKPGSSTP